FLTAVTPAVLTLLAKPGCHLCDAARDVVSGVVAELAGEKSAPPIVFEELSILDDPELLAQYSEEIPVLLINGRVHNTWRVDAGRLRTALLEV
ncbi:MAG: thioredoxin family protein, partial [Microbacteriaceae bacterium]|nr:thioredoxin family protein [Microbacteriaceae bacterium]